MAISSAIAENVRPSAGVETSLYVMGATGRALVTVGAVNRSGSIATVRIAQVPGGGSAAAKDWKTPDLTLPVDRDIKSDPFYLAANDELRVFTDTLGVNFTVNGQLISD